MISDPSGYRPPKTKFLPLSLPRVRVRYLYQKNLMSSSLDWVRQSDWEVSPRAGSVKEVRCSA